jgi:hypothetical protein
LLDFWCGHPNQAQDYVPVTEWTTSQWQKAKVYLHPQLKTEAVKAELAHCITQLHPFEISKQLPIARRQVSLDSTIAACVLLPLIERSAINAVIDKALANITTIKPSYSGASG